MNPRLMISKELFDTIIIAWLSLLLKETIMLAIYMGLNGLHMMMYSTHKRPTKGHTMGQMKCSTWMAM